MPATAIVKPQPGDEVTSAWGTSVADALNGIQVGQASLSGSGTNLSVVVTFPRAYTTPPIVLVSNYGSTVTASCAANAVTATGFTARVFSPGGQAMSGTQLLNWIAVGPPA